MDATNRDWIKGIVRETVASLSRAFGVTGIVPGAGDQQPGALEYVADVLTGDNLSGQHLGVGRGLNRIADALESVADALTRIADARDAEIAAEGGLPSQNG